MSDPTRPPRADADSLLGAPADDLDSSELAPSSVNWFVFLGSAGVVVLITAFTLAAPEAMSNVLGTLVGWITAAFGWWYMLLAAALVFFVLFICLSRYGKYRLGPEESRPEYGMFTWTAMLFAAGIGADLMFYSVAEPVAQYLAPPTIEGETIQAAREAVTWTLFHYGISGWAMYAVMGMALGYFSFRHGLPLSIRSALYPIFGKRLKGRLGDTLDLAAVLGTIFGIATSLGISIALLNVGLNQIFGIAEGRGAQVGLVVVSVMLGTISAVSGVDKGIRRLSELNVLLSVALMLYVLFLDKTGFLLNALVMNVGDFITSFPGMAMDTMAYEELASGDVAAWKSLWTLFFWAWWVAWAPFVGLFLARISRGRTIRQFLVGVLVIPFTFILMWVSIFGNSAISRIKGGDAAFGEVTANRFEVGFYAFLDGYPAAGLVIVLATLTGFLYYVTSADSGALVLGNFTSRLSHPMADCSIPMRIFWSVAIGVLTIAMMFAGGDNWLGILTGATIIMGLPFSVVIALVAVGIYKSLRMEAYKSDSMQYSLPSAISAGRGTAHLTLPQRLRRSVTYPSHGDVEEFLVEVGRPALEEVANVLNDNGLTSVVRESRPAHGLPGLELLTELGTEPSFIYRLEPRACKAPTFAVNRVSAEYYYRPEVHLAEGTQGYSVYGYTNDQLVGDILDQYERHMSYLHLVRSGDRAVQTDEEAPATTAEE